MISNSKCKSVLMINKRAAVVVGGLQASAVASSDQRCKLVVGLTLPRLNLQRQHVVPHRELLVRSEEQVLVPACGKALKILLFSGFLLLELLTSKQITKYYRDV